MSVANHDDDVFDDQADHELDGRDWKRMKQNLFTVNRTDDDVTWSYQMQLMMLWPFTVVSEQNDNEKCLFQVQGVPLIIV